MSHVYIISGPSGVGKGTVLAGAIERYPSIHVAISATTRAPRLHEEDGVNYHFLSNEAFDQEIANEGFVEWCHVHGNRYGTLVKEVFYSQHEGPICLEIDVQGAEKIKQKHPNVITIFIAPPTMSHLQERLEKRNTEAKEVIASRLDMAEEELDRMIHYDYVVVNEVLETAVRDVVTILEQHEEIRVGSIY